MGVEWKFQASVGMAWRWRAMYEINNEPVDLAEYQIRMDLRTSRAANAAKVATVTATINMVARLGEEEEEIAEAASDGSFTLYISAETMQDISPGIYYYDLIFVPPSGDAQLKMNGPFEVNNVVTRYWEDNT